MPAGLNVSPSTKNAAKEQGQYSLHKRKRFCADVLQRRLGRNGKLRIVGKIVHVKPHPLQFPDPGNGVFTFVKSLRHIFKRLPDLLFILRRKGNRTLPISKIIL